MSYKIFYIGMIFLGICGGCGLNEGVIQKETTSFLWFTGDTQNAMVYIDDLSPISLDNMNEPNKNKTNRKKTYYEISPGKHTIIVKKIGQEVVNRTVLLGSGITKEIKIP